MSALRIEDYALIGNCHTAALVGNDGSIDWWCAPRFDAPACFAALLGTAEHGRWLIAPVEPVISTRRQYVDDTMVLQTTFVTASGEVTITDFMPYGPDAEAAQLVRLIEGVRGRVPMRLELVMRFDYGSRTPWVTDDGGVLQAIAGPEMLRLHSKVKTRGENLKTHAEFEVAAGERVPFVLTHGASHLAPPVAAEPIAALEASVKHWSGWSGKTTYRGHYQAAVQRSLLTLKALTHAPTGGIVAAPTTSLPESIGGTRNWDYRFCWVRDATITLHALLTSGYHREAIDWRNWLLRAIAGSSSQPQVMYGIGGESRLTEMELSWLPGHHGSKPVRIGNGAHTQLQLDTFGELMGAMYQCRRAGLESADSWSLEVKLMEFLEGAWSEPDEGIWEVRGPRRHFVHSKAMAWVAFDRAIRSCEEFGQQGPVARWKRVRNQIHADVCSQGVSKERGCFVQSYGSQALDASLLMMAVVGFLPADDPRIVATVSAIERELLFDDTFVRRYVSDEAFDGLPTGEGAFLACSFWLVSNRMLQGRVDEATALFERLIALRNDVGLLSEEYDPHQKRFLGNFPQAFSHLALVNAAVGITNGDGNSASPLAAAT